MRSAPFKGTKAVRKPTFDRVKIIQYKHLTHMILLNLLSRKMKQSDVHTTLRKIFRSFVGSNDSGKVIMKFANTK